MRHGWKCAGYVMVAGALASCASEPSSQTDTWAPQTFVETLGNDTVAVETFVRSESAIEGTVVSRSPATSVVRYRASLDAEGHISGLEADWWAGEALDGSASSRASVSVDGGAARIIRERAEGTDTVEVELEGALVPNFGRSLLATAMVDHATRLAASDSARSMPVSVLSVLGGRASSNAVEVRSEGVYSLSYFGNPLLVVVDGSGGVETISGIETTNKVEIEPAVDLDAMVLAADFAARDAAGRGLGVPSPRDTARAIIEGAELEIVYSRPSARGREIWGGLVPYDEVWRTGANAATHFSTSRPIRLGDLDVPAGTYTLWSTYTEDGGTLIVNSQTGQWGTAYDAEQDLGTASLAQRSTEESVERFTFELAAGDGRPELRLAWADRVYVVPVAVR